MTKLLLPADSKSEKIHGSFAASTTAVGRSEETLDSVQSGSAPLGSGATSFLILHDPPGASVARQWRAFLRDCDYPTHYTAPEFFLEPSLRGQNPFAVLSIAGENVTGVLTGINKDGHVRSGLSVRPQIALPVGADRAQARQNLLAGLLAEAKSARLVDLFSWPETAGHCDARFRQRPYEGVIMLDLARGPEALFRKFSDNKRTNIKKAIKYGVSVEPAKTLDEISAYYAICADWSQRKALPMPAEAEFHETFALTGNRVLFLARHEGKIIAGVVIRFFPHGVMEYAANSSLESALRLRPNDLLHWRAIEWGCAAGIVKYSLGGAHLFLRKFGGQLVPTTRYRLDLSLFRRHALGDWAAEKAEAVRPMIPDRALLIGRSLRGWLGRRDARR
jgi:Acetyltransferase (GNAT) domain